MYDRGLYPYTRRYLPTFRNHFSTIGVNGMNELLRNFSNDSMDITTEEGRKFAEEILEFIRLRMQEYQEETGNLYNLEATPAEGTTHRFARKTRNATRTSSRPALWASATTPTVPSSPWTTRTTCSGLSSSRTNSSAAIQGAPSSTCT